MYVKQLNLYLIKITNRVDSKSTPTLFYYGFIIFKVGNKQLCLRKFADKAIQTVYLWLLKTFVCNLS